MSSLSHAFLRLDPAEHEISRVMMVGAKAVNSYLNQTDGFLLHYAIKRLHEWKVPFSAAFNDCLDDHHLKIGDEVSVINILPEFGGKDFLFHQEKASLVMFCNIARYVDKNMKFDAGYAPPMHCLRDSFMSSPLHDDIPRWREKLNETGANFVFISGIDSFEFDELNDGNYVSLQTGNISRGFLIRKEYLENAEAYLCAVGSPLIRVLEGSFQGETSFAYDARKRNVRSLPPTPR